MNDLRGLDNWITGGHYYKSYQLVTCHHCNETTSVLYEYEYGAGSWTPEECGYCKEPFEGDEEYEDYDPKEDLY